MTTLSNNRQMASSTRKQKGNKSKSAVDKSNLEMKIKDLMAIAKTKDTEIRSLKSKLDQMIHLLGERDDSPVLCRNKKFNRLGKFSVGDKGDSKSGQDEETELINLKKENKKLKEELKLMLLEAQHDTATTEPPFLHSKKPIAKNVFIKLLKLSTKDSQSSFHGSLPFSIESDQNFSKDLSDAFPVTMPMSSTEGGSEDKDTDDSISETSSVTVACLTERIHQMEESHISTHEELEATVQELNDLQKSIPELTIDNNRLQKEKEYLEAQLEILEKRGAQQSTETKHLRVLLSDQFVEGSCTGLQQQYLLLLDERKQLLHDQEALNEQLQLAGKKNSQSEELVYALQERMRHLERELNQAQMEKSLLDKKLKNIKDSIDHENAKTLLKLKEDLVLERQKNEDFVKMSNLSTNVAESLENLRIKNQKLKKECAAMEEEMDKSQQEIERMDRRVADLEEELEAITMKSKRDLSELSEAIDKLQEELRIKQASLDEANETLFVMEDSVEQHVAVKKHDNHIIQQLQQQLSSIKEEKFRLEKEIQQLHKEQRNQSEEWKQFQSDLQMAVMIANDMKAETQSEVARLREENHLFDKEITKLRVENDQLLRKRVPPVLESSTLHRSCSSELGVLRENTNRRTSEASGVQGLINSFNNQTSSPNEVGPIRSSIILSTDGSSYKERKSPVTAAVSPIPRHHMITPINSNALSDHSTTSNPSSDRNLSSLLRHNSAVLEERKPDGAKCDNRQSSSAQYPLQLCSPSKLHSLSLSSNSDPLSSLARRYGGSKRNALLRWCQEKTENYLGVDITNFSSSWSDGLALCAVLHSYLPAHIPYETLHHNYVSSDEVTRPQFQAKNFCLAFAAAESVGIEPTLTISEMMNKERPDWQRVMAYITHIYKYFET